MGLRLNDINVNVISLLWPALTNLVFLDFSVEAASFI